MKAYIVRQGDYLAKLAHQMGFSAVAVWDDPRNVDLKTRRTDMNMLCPGDVLFVPDTSPTPLPIQKGVNNRYSASIPRVSVFLLLRDGDKPMADESYTIEGLGDPVPGITGPDGKVVIEANMNVREVTLRLASRHVTFQVRIGDLDPVGERSGALQRLGHLRHVDAAAEAVLRQLAPDSEVDAGQRLASAVATFQYANGLPVTGELDDATQQALVDAHGH